MNVNEAIKALQEGKMITREGYGKDTYIEMVHLPYMDMPIMNNGLYKKSFQYAFGGEDLMANDFVEYKIKSDVVEKEKE